VSRIDIQHGLLYRALESVAAHTGREGITGDVINSVEIPILL
jgi:hypothetical protein